MSVDLGDRLEDSSIYFMWSTNAADGSSITRATDGTISVYKNDDLTQSVAGITDTEDFDSVTGVHMCVIDTSADAFYATAEDYTVVLSGATIDGKIVNAVLAVFSIENRFMRGTDSAALAATALSDAIWTNTRAAYLDATISSRNATTPPTVIATREEMEKGGAVLSVILQDTGTTIPDQITALNDISTAQVNTECDTALSDIHLDHLLAANYDPAAKPGSATALLNELVEDDGGISRYTANALEQAPTGGSAPTVDQIADGVWDELKSEHTTPDSFGDYLDDEITSRNATTPPTVTAIRQEMDTNSADLNAILTDTNELQINQGAWATATGFSTHSATDVWAVASRILTASTNFNDISTAQVNTECDTALTDIHLDHLLAANYDPASKPGVATALLNELVENDAGVSRYTANALEQAPTGGSAPTAVENRQEMDSNSTRLSAIEADTAGIAGSAMRGTDNAALASALITHDGKLDTVDANVDSILVDTGTTIPADLTTMKQTTAGTYNRDTDSLEAIRDRGDSAWSAAAGNPNVLIDTTIATLSTQTSFTLTAGSDDDDAYKDQAIVIYDASNNDYPSVRKVSGYAGATKTITLDTAADFTATTGDGIKTFVTAPGTTAPTSGQVADAVWDELKSGHTVPDSFGDLVDETLTRGDVAIGVWDEPQFAHQAGGSFGEIATEIADIPTISEFEARSDLAGTAAGLHTTTDALVTTVDSNVDTILVDTNELQLNQGNWATATSVTVSDKTGFELSAAGVDAILDENVEGTHSLREMMRLFASMLVGKVSGGGTTTISFRDIDDSKNRIVMTVTDEGNRTGVVLTEN